jgi:hypothetical protein
VLNIPIMTIYLAWSSKRVSHLISTHPSIINQIQASITGETIYRLDRYDEMQCDKNKIEYIQGKSTSSPSNQAIGMANTKLPTQRSKTRSIKGFGENISQLPLCINIFHHYISLFNMVSQEVVSHFDMFCSPMENWVLG